MDTPESNGDGRLKHLEKLFLIAQFYARDTDEAARIVDLVYRELGPIPTNDLSALVERLISAARSMQTSSSAASEAPFRRAAQTARAREAGRHLDERSRLRFLALDPDEKLALWHAVETGGEPGVLLESDALGSFVRSIESGLSEEQRAVFGEFVNRSTVSASLRRFWETGFVPVPPTLRAVVESEAVRRRGESPSPRSAPARPEEKKGRRLLRRISIYAWVVAAAGILGYMVTRVGEPAPPSSDILQLSLSASDRVELTFRTDNAEQAERFIRDRFGWRLSMPEIVETSLEGISLVTILDSVQLPVFVYNDLVSGDAIHVFTFPYGFLESNSERVALSRETLEQIQESARFDIHQYRNRTAVVWRDRDDIFVAFVDGNDAGLESRVVSRS